MSDEALVVDDLMKRMSVRILNGTCEFVLGNETPPEWRVRIKEGGCKFFYSDGGSDIDGPKNLNLDSGDYASFYSRDSTKCVKQCFLAIKVNVPDEGDQTATYATEVAKEKECWTRQGVTLAPTNVINEADLGAAASVQSQLRLVPASN